MAAIGFAEARVRVRTLGEALPDTLSALAPSLLFGIRFWLSVCVTLFVAFWLELDKPMWAGISAAVVCQPHLGASLNKASARVIGTVMGATFAVVLTGVFPQDRVVYLGFLALWCGVCAFAATVLRNFGSYAAALAGFTAVIVAVDSFGTSGGAGPDVFMLAVKRASEICIGIGCAGLVLTVTDLGGDRRRLASAMSSLASDAMAGFARMLALAGPQMPDTRPERRALIRRTIGFLSEIDQTFGEGSQLHVATQGLFAALSGWRGVATHLRRSPEDAHRQQAAEAIYRILPPQLQSASDPGALVNRMSDPLALHRTCTEAVLRIGALPTDTPSQRLLVDETASALRGILRVLDGVAILVDAEPRPSLGGRGFTFGVADWLPAFVNAVRAVIVFAALALFWIVTAWPDGAWALVFASIVVLMLAPRGDLAYGGAIMFALGTATAVPLAAAVKFGLLPVLQTFPAFCLALGLVLIPAGFAMVHFQQQPALRGFFMAMGFNFVPLIDPTNQMSYDTAAFYNSALAIVVGCTAAPIAFRLLPQLSPALRARRLLALSLRDLRRLAMARQLPGLEQWDGRILGRLAAMPDQAEPLHRTRLLAMLSIGSDIIRLRELAPSLGVMRELDAAFEAFAQGRSAIAIARLNEIDRDLSSGARAEPNSTIVLRARSHLLVISEALGEYGTYFDDGAGA